MTSRHDPTPALPLRAIALAGLAIVLGACRPVPGELRGDTVDISPAEARVVGREGLPVRWGGRIVATRPMGQRTCFELIGSALSVYARPRHMADEGYGRFVACAPGFYDPALYLKNREVTVLGRIEGFEPSRLATPGYAQPRVAATSVYLWPQAPDSDPRYPYPRRPWPWWGWDWPDTRY